MTQSREQREWRKVLDEEWQEAKAARAADQQDHEADYKEKYGCIPRGKGSYWNPPQPPVSPSQQKAHPAHIKHGAKLARRKTWRNATFPGSSCTLVVDGTTFTGTYGFMLGVQQVRGGTIS